MENSQKSDSSLDPNLRAKLLKESKRPFAGLRRVLWVALFGSAGLGFLIMFSRIISGELVALKDVGIQTSALLIFGTLIWFDRSKGGD